MKNTENVEDKKNKLGDEATVGNLEDFKIPSECWRTTAGREFWAPNQGLFELISQLFPYQRIFSDTFPAYPNF